MVVHNDVDRRAGIDDPARLGDILGGRRSRRSRVIVGKHERGRPAGDRGGNNFTRMDLDAVDGPNVPSVPAGSTVEAVLGVYRNGAQFSSACAAYYDDFAAG